MKNWFLLSFILLMQNYLDCKFWYPTQSEKAYVKAYEIELNNYQTQPENNAFSSGYEPSGLVDYFESFNESLVGL